MVKLNANANMFIGVVQELLVKVNNAKKIHRSLYIPIETIRQINIISAQFGISKNKLIVILIELGLKNITSKPKSTKKKSVAKDKPKTIKRRVKR